MEFRLATMQTWLAAITWVGLALPAIPLFSAIAAPPPTRWVLIGATVFMALAYASVWLAWRPTRFEVGVDTLRIVWPIRSRSISRSDVESAEILSGASFRREFGPGMRIGAGGLWGGFGLLKTHRETFSMWISRTDQYVLVRIRGARTLLITPDEPARFVQAVAPKRAGARLDLGG